METNTPIRPRVLLGHNTLGWPRLQAARMSIFRNGREMRNFGFPPQELGRIRQSFDAFSMGIWALGKALGECLNIDIATAFRFTPTDSIEWAGLKQGGRG